MKKILSVLLALVLILPCFSMVTVGAASQITGNFIGATLNLGATLTIDYYATLSQRDDSVCVNFTSSSGRKTTVNGVFDESMNAYKFSYTGINPQCMTDVIDASLVLSGNELAKHTGYSVQAYCDNQAKKSAGELKITSSQFSALRTLLADVLVYGSAAQKYKNYNTEKLADNLLWVGNFKSLNSNPNGVRNVYGNADLNNCVTALGVNLSNVIKIYFKIKLTDNNVSIALNGKNVDKGQLTLTSDNVYVLYTEDIKATEFDDIYTLTLTKDGNEISKVEYNVNAYAETKNNNANVGEIVKALYNYGYSAEQYIKAMNNIDEDFDLGDEDTFGEEFVYNLVDEVNSNFESATSLSDINWGVVNSSDQTQQITLALVDDAQQGKALKMTTGETVSSWYSLSFDIMPLIKNGGTYTISFKYKVTGATNDIHPFAGIIRCGGQTSFTNDQNYKNFGAMPIVEDGIWYEANLTLLVENTDINQGSYWKFCFHNIQSTVKEIYIDDFKLVETIYNDTAQSVNFAETWVANELVLISDKEYADPFNEVTVDLVLTSGETRIEIPGFWDGGNTWRVRFACPTAGQWTYTTVCSDTENKGLHDVKNTFTCMDYSTGDLEVYKRGFVTTSFGEKYFTYSDGTPFFYLGDTHWSTAVETIEMVETIIEKRVQQGYTVYQSEPLGVSFNLVNGVTITDISGLRQFDERFKLIADAGLTHANAQFFFPTKMNEFINNNGGYDKNETLGSVTHAIDNIELPMYDLSKTAKDALYKLCRYWVARYSAYPVMWTMAQEVDNDFFWEYSGSKDHQEWAYVNNPYRYVAQYMGELDPYKHPLSAHMEHSGFGVNNTVANYGDPIRSSAFNDISAHNWYAAQWKSLYNGKQTADIANIAENFWNSEKISINYEGKYWMLATKDFGARAQAWGSLLSGMFGHGWGGQDTWSYLSNYTETENDYYGTESDYIDIVTPAEKQGQTWEDALNSDSAAQMGYMKKFFEETVGDWQNLIPRFEKDSSNSNGNVYLTRESKNVSTGFLSSETVTAYAVIASSADNREIVTYFYNFTDTNIAKNTNSKILKEYWDSTTVDGGTLTGTFCNLTPGAAYNYKWFNPATGEFTGEGSFTANSNGQWSAGSKATCDMVLYISKA